MSDRDKVHCFMLFGTNGGPALTGVEVADYFGQPSLRGECVSGQPGHWTEGTTGYVILSQVQSVVIFESVAEYMQALDRFQRTRRGGGGPDAPFNR